MTGNSLCAVYDFELFPYALGDVLTWNVRTAIRCAELGRDRVDVYICLDERFPSSIYQRGLVTAENSGLFLNELFGAFGTHPKLGNLHVYRRREELLERLRQEAKSDAANAEAVAEYAEAVANRDDEDALIRYFTHHLHTHEQIIAYAKRHGGIPLLRPSMGCEPDVTGLVAKRFAGKSIVAIQVRLRRLDPGYGGEHTYARDSDFLEWYAFLREAGTKHPNVQFVALGRLQEKPLELLRLPNVMSLRTLGLGLGHELTLMLRSDLFIGTSSGFAAMANFSEVPYFITRMTRDSCNAYCIPYGTERLPFATERQVLVYEPESQEMLMRLLERGLQGRPPRSGTPGPAVDPAIDVRSWEWERSLWLHPGATTSRFFTDDIYRNKETAFLLWPKLKEALAAWRRGLEAGAWKILDRMEAQFPFTCEKYPDFLRLRMAIATARNDAHTFDRCKASLMRLVTQERQRISLRRSMTQYWARGFPTVVRLKSAWNRKHRIPRKILGFIRSMVSSRGRPDR